MAMRSSTGWSAMAGATGNAAAALAYASHIWPIARLRWIVGSMAVTNLVLVAAIGLLQAQSPLGIAREAGLAALLYSPGAAVLGLGGIVLLQQLHYAAAQRVTDEHVGLGISIVVIALCSGGDGDISPEISGFNG